MGMAASQARFLGLTARKTNVEFEGQQVNQQRTALANQSANYYNQLLGMTVPTPPSVDDFTKTVYTFTDGNLSNNITSLIAQANGTYKVSYVSRWQNDFTPVTNGAAIVFQDNTDPLNPIYKVSAQTLRKIGTAFAADDPYYQTIKDSPALVRKALEEEAEYKKLLQDKYGSGTDWYIRYIQDTTSGTWTPIFYNKTTVDTAIYDKTTGASQSNITSYKMGSAVETEEVKGVNARLEKDATGRYISIVLNPGTNQELAYSLTTSTTTDQAAYNDAMNQYEFNKYQYDQSIQEVNAKIEIVQAEDKNLELRLKQLDTEQDAIQTEMDAVQKVIEKNTESTFKTFG